MKLTDCLSIIQTVLLFGGFLLAAKQLWLLAKQVELMSTQIHDQLDWSRKEATFQYIGKFLTDLREVNAKLQQKLGIMRHDGKAFDTKTIQEMLKDADTRVHMFELVGFFEHMAIGIDTKFLDESIARESLENVVRATYKSVVPYIEIRRQETGKQVATNFEKLASRWEVASERT